MKKYRLKFKLTKHKDARPFYSEIVAGDNDDIQGIKEERAMYYEKHFEKMYNTPVRCVEITEIKPA